VLTMEYLDGQHVDAFLASNPSQARRDAFGEKMYLAAFRLYYRARMNYADPHPGNYLFRDDGTLGLIDFGCVRRFDDAEMRLILDGEEAFDGGRTALRAFLERFCDLTPEQARDEERLAVLEESFRWFTEPLLVRPFDFGDARHLQLGFDVLARMVRQRYTQAHPLQIYLTRAVVGLRAMLYRLQARVDVHALHQQELAAVDRTS
jgi:aarF domain-containing kinase